MSRNIFKQAGILLILSSVILVITADRFFIASAEIKSFPGYLLEASRDEISSFSPSLAARIFFRNETEANMAAAGAVFGAGGSGQAGIPPSAQAHVNKSLPIPLLLYRALSAADLASCRRLSSLWIESPAGLFSCAASLEEGSSPAARKTWDTLPEEDRNSWLGRRILQQLSLAEAAGTSPLLPVYSRRGVPMGILSNGRLSLDSGLQIDHLLPALEESLRPLQSPGLRGVRTSIDLNLQKAARESLDGFRGSIVLLDSSTGEILAAASDPRTLRSDPSAPFSQQYEPASISKLITSSAAMRVGINVDEFMEETVCNGGKKYSGEILWCSFRSGRLGSLSRALADSCNIAFADLGVAAGRKAIIDELQVFGFDRKPAGPFHFGRILHTTGNDRQLADLSIGLESTTITPVHAALMAAPFANDGIMPEPTLISSADGILGLSPKKFPVRPGSWIINDPESLKIIGSAMREVVSNGTARGLPTNGFPVAMKTGTGRTSGTGYVTNYVGFGPLPDPSIAFCIRVTHQPTSSRVRKATREVLTRLLEKLSE